MPYAVPAQNNSEEIEKKEQIHMNESENEEIATKTENMGNFRI